MFRVQGGNTRTIAAAVREAAMSMRRFSAAELRNYDYGRCITRQQINNVIKDFVRRGEFRRVERGVIDYIERPKPRTKTDIIWHLIRSHRQFEAAEIVRLSGAVYDTVKKYLTRLSKLGYVKRSGRTWRLIRDPGPETPAFRKGRNGEAESRGSGEPGMRRAGEMEVIRYERD